MNLHKCTIIMNNKEIITSDSVEQSLGIIEHQAANRIATVQIDAFDGQELKTFMCHSIEESLENLMNL